MPIVLNARAIFSTSSMVRKTRVSRRSSPAKAHLAAGADCVYPFDLRDPATIATLVKAVGGTVNITNVGESGIQKLATALCATGGFKMLTVTLHHPNA